MDNEALVRKYVPMTETAFYILLALTEPKHGYGISKWVSEHTNKRINIGSGTMYGTLGKMENDKLICLYDEIDNKKLYEITSRGRMVLKAEIDRLKEVVTNSEYFVK